MTSYGGLSRQQCELMDSLSGVFGNERAYTEGTAVQLGETWQQVAAELVTKGLVQTEAGNSHRYWLSTAGIQVCADMALHREYNRQAPPGWRTA